MTKEWDWEVEAEKVDLDRLHQELSGIPAAAASSYLLTLVRKSPIVYKRYRDREIKRRGKFQICNWEELNKKLK